MIEDSRTLHFFKLFGEEKDVEKLAKEKALELNGEYLITKSYNKVSINVVITCVTNGWKTKLINPVIQSTIKGLCHAQ